MPRPDFDSKTIETLSKRSALRCNNPDCGVLTTGPHTENSKTLNIGEAAHIYGARKGAARYRPEMSDIERASITNGIWLCRTCHGKIDKDSECYPVNLLLFWKNSHENNITNEIGTAGEKIKNELLNDELREFSNYPAFIRAILREKPEHWQHMLTAELIDYHVSKYINKIDEINQNLVLLPKIIIPLSEGMQWIDNKPKDTQDIIKTIKLIIDKYNNLLNFDKDNNELKIIIDYCMLYEKISNYIFNCVCEMKFTYIDEKFRNIQKLYIILYSDLLNSILQLPFNIRKLFLNKNPKGIHKIDILFELPAEFEENYEKEIEQIIQLYVDQY